jgi:RNA-directed DNA polymerase
VALLARLGADTYQLSPQSVVITASGTVIHLWSSLDALVLKALAMILPRYLDLHPSCTHVKGHGGLKATVRNLEEVLPDYQFVLKTDVKGYYASIDHTLLLDQLADCIKHPPLFRLLCQFVKRSVECGGLYRDIQRGIARGCALSPVIGAFYLRVLDIKLTTAGLHYARYMDDIVVLAKTRWQLRRAVCALNQVFNALKVEQHPDKTFIGRIARGFDFLGYHFGVGALKVAAKTLSNMQVKYYRLYEQQPPGPERDRRLGNYLKRWLRWVGAGLGDDGIDAVVSAAFGLRLRLPASCDPGQTHQG